MIKSAIVVAATVYHLAMRPDPLPRFSKDEMPRRAGARSRDDTPRFNNSLAILDQAYNRPSWHGTNLRGSIRRVSAQAGGVEARAQAPQHLGDRACTRLTGSTPRRDDSPVVTAGRSR